MTQRTYLDNAATSWPKPPRVIAEISRYYDEIGVAAGRGTSTIAAEVDRTIETCRLAFAKLINASCERVVFAFNGTDAIHLALQGLIRDGDDVVTTVIEHNSMIRPLKQWEADNRIRLAIAGSENGKISVDGIRELIGPTTRICCVSAVSNVTGVIQPVEEIAAICRQQDCLLMVDAAQAVGHIDVDFEALGCDVLATSGHKGLLGPLGTGLLCLSERAAEQIRPTRMGGTGTHSEIATQPTELPYRLESGNLNVGGIFGLKAGLDYLAGIGIESISQHEESLRCQILAGLQAYDTVEVYGGEQEVYTGIVSLNVRGQDAHTITSLLDSAFGIQVRAGLHCAPWIHKEIGSDAFGGTVRISPGAFSTAGQIEYLLDAIGNLTAQLV